MITDIFRPEGALLESSQNKEYLSSLAGLERAMSRGAIIEGIATLCDEEMRLHVDLHCAQGIIEADQTVACRTGESKKDIAVITRVGKPVACKILSIECRGGVPIVKLSRRAAQEACIKHYMKNLCSGDILHARVTHLEPFGAFVDVGCGVPSLLSVDCISVSRISHPRDRLACGMTVPVVVKCVNRESERIYVSLRELLGTWEENAAAFDVGQTVTGIVRSIESYGVFVELAPNLAGLAEVDEEEAAILRSKIGQSVAVYIKSILPERMKIKLVLIDACCSAPAPRTPLRFYIDTVAIKHLARWRYSPMRSPRVIETVFDTDVSI
jgi:small subunit ribosomal protein S1